MNGNIERFVDSIESANSKKVAMHVFNKISDTNIEKLNLIQLEQLVINTKPTSPKEIITITYILSSYVKWLQEQHIVEDDNVYQIIQSLDKKLLWAKAKPHAKKKFISNKQFKRAIHDIEMFEEHNPLYYTTLFRAVYEGIYNDDLSVLKNLRKSDINENVVTLKEDDGHTDKIKISDQLSKDLAKLADINIWERKNRFGVCKVDMRGVHSDSVFKVEQRSTAAPNSYRFSYYSKLRKIAKEYLEQTLLPLQLYASGIMYRIKMELEKNDITLEDAFSQNSRNRTAHIIISKELIRCNSNIEIGNFRELVKGHLDSF